MELPGPRRGPVESAAYFAVSETLTNAVKHSGARTASGWTCTTRRRACCGSPSRTTARAARDRNGLGAERHRTPTRYIRRRPGRQQPGGRPHHGDHGDPLRDRGTTVNHGAEVRLQVRPPLGDDELNALFAASWPDHRHTAFGPRLARSLLGSPPSAATDSSGTSTWSGTAASTPSCWTRPSTPRFGAGAWG